MHAIVALAHTIYLVGRVQSRTTSDRACSGLAAQARSRSPASAHVVLAIQVVERAFF